MDYNDYLDYMADADADEADAEMAELAAAEDAAAAAAAALAASGHSLVADPVAAPASNFYAAAASAPIGPPPSYSAAIRDYGLLRLMTDVTSMRSYRGALFHFRVGQVVVHLCRFG